MANVITNSHSSRETPRAGDYKTTQQNTQKKHSLSNQNQIRIYGINTRPQLPDSSKDEPSAKRIFHVRPAYLRVGFEGEYPVKPIVKVIGMHSGMHS